MLNNTQLAYLAGMIDCDGSLECQKQMQKKGTTHRYAIRLSFTMATKEPINTISKWFGLNYKKYPSVDSRRSPRYRIHIPKTITLVLLKNCLHYLVLKKRQAEILLEIESIRLGLNPGKKHYGKPTFQCMPPEWETQIEPLYRELRSLKSNKRPGSPGWQK